MADEQEAFTVAAVRGALQSEQSTATEHVERAASRWQATHDWLNALVQPRFEAAEKEAAAITAADPRPLAGVPVSIKDCFPLAGLRTTLGIEPRREQLDQRDCQLVQQIRASGAVIVGKANVPQALYLHESDNPVFGRTVNPVDRQRGPGGSSGGDAAAVAAGVVPLAFGNDLAGSIRQPAHACGIVGYVPSRGRLGTGGAYNTMPSLRGLSSRAGVLARTVADAVAGVEAVAGCSLREMEPGRSPVVGWWETAGPVPPSPAVVRGVRQAVASLQTAEMPTRPVDESLSELAGWLHLGLVSGDGGAAIQRLLQGSPPIPQVAELIHLAGLPRWQRPLLAGVATLVGRRIEAAAVRKTGPLSPAEQQVLLRARETLALLMKGWRQTHGIDAVVCPVSALPALRHGTAGRLILAAFPCLFAMLLDLPTATVPVTRVRASETTGRGLSLDPVLQAAAATDAGSTGLPIGVQVIAIDGRDQTAIRVMAAIERGSATQS